MASLEKTSYSSSSSEPGVPTPTDSPPNSPKLTSSSLRPPPPPSPTHQQTLRILAFIYPLTIITGGLFSLFSPTGKNPNYFSHKTNVFNLLFVKIGWFWTTAAFFWHTSRLRHTIIPNSRTKAVFRWLLATLFWIAITQWFFGAPLMDRTFTITGGACQPNADGYLTSNKIHSTDAGAVADEVFTSAACRLAGGRWSGGHDLSGHVFMLTHASMFLWAEIMPRLLDSAPRMEGRGEFAGVHWFVWMILGMWWWMLLMTSVYFHTWQEKLTGWFVSLLEWGLIYAWALPSNEQARSLLGVPGL